MSEEPVGIYDSLFPGAGLRCDCRAAEEGVKGELPRMEPCWPLARNPCGGHLIYMPFEYIKIPPKEGGSHCKRPQCLPSPLLTAVGCLSPLPFPCLGILMSRFPSPAFSLQPSSLLAFPFPPSLSLSSLSLPLRHREKIISTLWS